MLLLENLAFYLQAKFTDSKITITLSLGMGKNELFVVCTVEK